MAFLDAIRLGRFSVWRNINGEHFPQLLLMLKPLLYFSPLLELISLHISWDVGPPLPKDRKSAGISRGFSFDDRAANWFEALYQTSEVIEM